jgi:cytochrome c556
MTNALRPTALGLELTHELPDEREPLAAALDRLCTTGEALRAEIARLKTENAALRATVKRYELDGIRAEWDEHVDDCETCRADEFESGETCREGQRYAEQVARRLVQP